MADANEQSPAAQSSSFDEFDFGNGQHGYQDRDAQMAEMRQVHESMPPEYYMEAQESMQRLLGTPDAQKLTGEGKEVGHLYDTEQPNHHGKSVFDQLKNVDPALLVAEALDAATKLAIEAAAQASQNPTNSAAGQGNSAAAPPDGTKPPADRPLDLEQTLASMRMSPRRDERFVIAGDPKIEAAFYNELEARGKLHYQAGTPIIAVSKSKAQEILRMVAEREGALVRPAVKLEFDRTGNGGLSEVTNAVRNALGRSHSVEVFVVGDQATIDKKLADIGTLLQKLDSGKFLEGTDKSQFEGGKLTLEKDKPLELHASRSLQELVTMARNTVGDYQKEQGEKDAARSEFRNKELDEKMAKASGKDGADAGLTPTTGQPAGISDGAKTAAPAVPVKKFILDLQSGIHAATNTPGKLAELATDKQGNPTKQIVAEKLLNQVRTLNEKDTPELAKMTSESRQQMLTELSVVIAKADAGALGKQINSEKLDKAFAADPARDRPATPSIRDKVSQLIAAESAADPKFGDKALQLLANMEKAGTVSREHIVKAAESIKPGGTIPPAAVDQAFTNQAGDKAKTATTDAPATQLAKEAAAQTSVEQAKSASKESSADASKDAVSTAAKPTTTAAADAPTVPQSKGEASSTASTGEATSKSTDKAAEPVPSNPATAGGTDAAKASEQSSAKSAESVASGATTTTTSASTDASKASSTAEQNVQSSATATPEKVNALVDKLDAVTKAGPQSLSREDASAIIATLDGRQTAKLASLDDRSGIEPTKTLVRIEGVLNEVAKGRLGDDLAASAKDLGAALDKWKAQDAQRLSKEFNMPAASVVAFGNTQRTADGAWHGHAVKETQTATASSGLAESKTMSDSGKASGQGASDAARLSAAERYTHTESAAGKLANVMSNAAGGFLNKDKTWNSQAITSAVDNVLKLDIESTKQMSVGQRNQVAAYAAWIADKVNEGKLPGFDGPEGKAKAQALTAHATQLVGGASGELSPAISKQLVKADNMVAAMPSRPRGLGRGTGASRMGAAPASSRTASTASVDASPLGKAIGNAVFKSSSISDANATYMLQKSGTLSMDSMKTMTTPEKAQAVVGLAHLAEQVRAGAMGDFKSLSPAMQKQVASAEQTASTLQAEMSTDPKSAKALETAMSELRGGRSDAMKESTAPSATKDAMAGAEKAAKAPTGGRSLDR